MIKVPGRDIGAEWRPAKCSCYRCRTAGVHGRPAWLVRFLVFIGLAVAAGCGPKKPPCEPVADVKARWQREAKLLVDSGVCDKYSKLTDCPEWNALEASWAGRQTVQEAQCQ